MPVITSKTIRRYNPSIDAKVARNVEKVSRIDNSHETVDSVLQYYNNMTDAYGIESLTGRWVGGYYCDIQVLYVNTGDCYNVTLMYDCENDRFYMGSVGNWIEAYGERRRIS